MADFKEYGSQIASLYLNSSIVPTDSLIKIAQEHDLQPFEIDILAAEANKAIFHAKYASEQQKYFAAEFPHADAKTAKERLAPSVKVASAGFIDPIIEHAEVDLFELSGLQRTDDRQEKVASLAVESKVVEQKLSILQEKIANAKIMVGFENDAAQEKFVKVANEYVLPLANSDEKMKMLGVLDHLVKQGGFKCGKKMLAKYAYYLGATESISAAQAKSAIDYFTKEADCKAPQEFISQNLEAKIINGNHPLYITLKTVDDTLNKKMRLDHEGEIVDNKLNILRQKIQAL